MFNRLLLSFVILSLYLIPLRAQVEDKSIRVVSFNIRYDNPSDGENGWQFRKNRIAQFIRFHRADICGLQEALITQIHDLDSLLPEFDWIGVGRDDGKEKGEFCPIFFKKDRFKVLTQKTLWLSDKPSIPGSVGWDAALPRIVNWCILMDSVTSKEIVFVNTHFDHVGVKARELSAKMIIKEVSKYIKKYPLILTGDFNCMDTSLVHKIFKEGGLHDGFFVSKEPHYGPNSTWNGFKEIGNNQRIDFIYVNDHVSIIKHAILTDRWDGRFLSDHLPVVSEIIIR